jgi:hypothetical protein
MCHRHVTLTQTLSPRWLPQSALSKEGGNKTSPGDISKTQSGTQTNTWVKDIMLQTQMKTIPSAQSTSALTPYSGDLLSLSKANTKSPIQSQLNTDSESLTKKGKIVAGGDHSTEVLMTKNHWHKLSNSAATTGTPQTLTSLSLRTKQRNKPCCVGSTHSHTHYQTPLRFPRWIIFAGC